MKDKTLDALGERKVKVEGEHSTKLRSFWKDTLKHSFKDGSVEQKKAIDSLGVTLNSDLSDSLNIAKSSMPTEPFNLISGFNGFGSTSEISNKDEQPVGEDIKDYNTYTASDSELDSKINIVPEVNIAGYEDITPGNDIDLSFKLPNIQRFETDETVASKTSDDEKNIYDEEHDEPKFVLKNDLQSESEPDMNDELEIQNSNDEEITEPKFVTENAGTGLEMAYDEVKNAMAKMQDVIDSYKNKTDDLIQSNRNEIRRQGDSIISLTKDMRAEETKNHVLEDDNDELVRINRKLNSSLDMVRAEKVSAENKVTELGGVITERDNLITSLQRELARIQAKLEMSEKDVKTSKSNNAKLKDDIRRLRNDITTKDELIANLNRELAKNKAQNSRLESQIKGFTSGVVEVLDGLNDKQDKKRNSKKKMNNEGGSEVSDAFVDAFENMQASSNSTARRR